MWAPATRLPIDIIAFHLQQAAEKLLKALLASRGIVYPKTHDLKTLFALLPAEFQTIHSFYDQVHHGSANPKSAIIRNPKSGTASWNRKNSA